VSEIDAELVRRTMSGDRAAFEALVASHLARAHAVARSVLHDDPAVDDVVQEAFIRAYDHLGQLGDPATFPSWLGAIVRNQAISWIRRSARTRAVSLDHADSAPHPEPDGDPANLRLEKLRASLERLPASYREVLRLKYDAALNYDQIAETLGISVANVEKRLYRARQQLMAMMAQP
jgi:RNA polymerase sigma-70 factor (ECF subfamily)